MTQLLDHTGRPIAMADKPPAPPTGEIGWENSVLYGARDFAKYNPDDLVSRRGADIYRKMMRDDQVKSVMRFKQHAVISRGWFFDVPKDENGDDDPEQARMGDFFATVIAKLAGSFSQNLLMILSALPNGFSIVEKIFGLIAWEGKTWWGLKRLKLRPWETFNQGFECDPHGNVLKLSQDQNGKRAPIPMDKVIHFVYQPDVDPHYGESDLRAAYRPWWSKDVVIKFQNIHLERHASGFAYAQVTGQLSSAQKEDLKALIRNISARMGAILPAGVDLNQFQPMRTDAYDRAIAQYDKAIAKSILVPNLLGLSEQGQTGSYSQSTTQLEVFFWILDAIAGDLEDALNEQLFRGLARVNFGAEDFPPFTFEPISEQQKEKIARVWGELVSKNAVQRSDSDEAWIRQLVGAPQKSADDPAPPPPTDDPDPDAALPPDGMPDNEAWIEKQSAAARAQLARAFAERPWLKRCDFARIEDQFNADDQMLLAALQDVMAEARESIETQVAEIAGERSFGNVDFAEIDKLTFPKAIKKKLQQALRKHLEQSLAAGYAQARKELPRKFAAVIRPGMDKDQAERYLARKAMKIGGVVEADVLKAVQQVLENSIKYDKTLRETILAISEDTVLTALLPEIDAQGRAVNVPRRLENIARTNTADAVNQARQALFNQPEFKGFVLAFEYAAILDARTSEICEHLDGKILKDFGPWTPPNHHMCRSLLVPVTAVDDWDGKESPAPRIEPQKGFK